MNEATIGTQGKKEEGLPNEPLGRVPYLLFYKRDVR